MKASLFSEQTPAIAFAVSMVVGSGIFGLTGLALEMAGDVGSLWGWLLAALCTLPFLVLFHDLQKYCQSKKEFNQSAVAKLGLGLVNGMRLLFLATYLLVIPVIAYVGSTYLQKSLGFPPTFIPFLTVTVMTTAALLNYFKQDWVRRINRTSWLILIVFLMSLSLYHWRYALSGFQLLFTSVTQGAAPPWSTLGKTASLLLFAFIGWENLVIIPSPSPKVPTKPWIAYAISYFFVVGLYLSLALVFAGASHAGSPVTGINGLSVLLKQLPYWQVFSLGAVIVIISNVASWMYSATQLFTTVFCLGGEPLKKESDLNRSALFPLYATFVLIFSLIVSDIVHIPKLVQMVNNNFLVLYLLLTVLFFRVSRGFRRLAVTGLALTALVLLIESWKVELLYPALLLAVGWIRTRFSHKNSVSRRTARVAYKTL